MEHGLAECSIQIKAGVALAKASGARVVEIWKYLANMPSRLAC